MSDTVAIENNASQSVWSALLSIIDKPRQTFTNLLAEPRLKWMLPVVITIVVLIINVSLTAPYSSELAQAMAERQWQSAGLTAEQIEDIQAQSATFTSPMFTAIVGSVVGSIGLIVVWIIGSAFLYFTSLIAGGELKFSAVFIVISWAALPISLRSIIQTIYIAVSGKFPVYPGLAALQVTGDPLADSRNPLIAVLGYADPFWLWQFVLLVVGLAVAAKFSHTKSFFIVLLYGLLSIGVSVGLVMLSGALTPGG